MKMNLNLTTVEFEDVLNTIDETADSLGYDMDDAAFFEDLCTIVDAALKTMGIEYYIEDDEDEDFIFDDDDDDEYDEDDYDDYDEDEDEDDPLFDLIESLAYEVDEMTVIGGKVATALYDMFIQAAVEDGRLETEEEVFQVASGAFQSFCEEYGIEGVDMSELFEDEDE